MCDEPLAAMPQVVELGVLRARALVALRRDPEAQRELEALIKYLPTSSFAHQLLGEIAFRADRMREAEQYFRESWRLDQKNASARIWLPGEQSHQRLYSSVDVMSVLRRAKDQARGEGSKRCLQADGLCRKTPEG